MPNARGPHWPRAWSTRGTEGPPTSRTNSRRACARPPGMRTCRITTSPRSLPGGSERCRLQRFGRGAERHRREAVSAVVAVGVRHGAAKERGRGGARASEADRETAELTRLDCLLHAQVDVGGPSRRPQTIHADSRRCHAKLPRVVTADPGAPISE